MRWKKIKRIIAIIICLTLCFSCTACNKSDSTDSMEQKNSGSADSNGEQNEEIIQTVSGEKAMGRYVEETFDEPEYGSEEYRIDLSQSQNGEICILSVEYKQDQTTVYRVYTKTVDGWDYEELTWMSLVRENTYGYVSKVAKGTQGDWYILTEQILTEDDESMDGTTEKYLIKYTEETGKIEDVSPEEWFDDGNTDKDQLKFINLSGFTLTKNNSIVYYSDFLNEVHCYNPETKENLSITVDEQIEDISICDDTIYVLLNREKEIYCYNAVTGEVKNIMELEDTAETGQIAVTENHYIYFVNKNGIYRSKTEGTMWEQLLDGEDSVIGTSNAYLDQMLVEEGDYPEFFLTVLGREDQFVRIYFDDEIPTTKEQKLTIFSLFENEQVQDTIVNYQKANPEVDIDYVIAMEREDIASVEDQIRVVNSELLAGNGADIYVLDGLPSQDFIEKGVFADLSAVLEEDIQDGNLLDNIVAYYTQTTGAIYQLPLKFSVPVLVSNSLVTAEQPSLRDLISVCDQNPEEKVFFNIAPLRVMLTFLETYGNTMIEEDGQINLVEWKQYVNDVMTAKDNTTLDCEDDSMYSEMFDSLLYPGNETVLYSGCLEYMVCDEYLSTIYNMMQPDDIMSIHALTEQYDCNCSSMNDCFIPIGRLAVNASTENYEEATDFLQYAFSYDVQKTVNYTGFPMNKQSIEEWIYGDDHAESTVCSIGLEDGTEVSLEATWPSEDVLKKYYDFISGLKQPVMEDVELLSLLSDAARSVLEDGADIDQAANELQNKIKLYLSE